MGGSPADNTVNTLNPQLQQLIGDFTSVGVPALTSAIGGASSLTGSAASGLTTTQGQVENEATTLNNFQALSPADIAQLSTTSGAAVESAGRTAASTSGGVPNQALQDKNLGIQAGQQVGAEATQLGQVASTQNLAAKEAAGSLLSGLSSEDLNAILGSFSTLIGAGNTFSGAASTGVSGELGGAQIQEQEQSAKDQAIGSATGGIGSLATGAGSLKSAGTPNYNGVY